MATHPRVLKAVRHLNRFPEILRCRRHADPWLKLAAAYVGVHSQLPFEIKVPTGTFVFREPGDIATFWQIFYRRVYPVRPDDRNIIDAGANIGAFSLYALQAAPHANVTAVEPAPDSCGRIRSMLRANGMESRCTLHEVALGTRRGETHISLAGGSQFRMTGLSGHPVPTETLDSLIPQGMIVDLLKMDIEGAEYEVLNSASPETLQRIRRVVIEFHPKAPAAEAIKPFTSNGLRMYRYQDDGEGYGVAWFDRPEDRNPL